MQQLVQSQRHPTLPEGFSPKRCILLYPADDAAWSLLVTQKHPLWSDGQRDFAFIGYLPGKHKELPQGLPPFHLLLDTDLEQDFSSAKTWLQRWQQPADLLLIANPAASRPLLHLSARLPAIFRGSLYETEFGELYQLILSSGAEKPAERLDELLHYLQKIMKL